MLKNLKAANGGIICKKHTMYSLSQTILSQTIHTWYRWEVWSLFCWEKKSEQYSDFLFSKNTILTQL